MPGQREQQREVNTEIEYTDDGGVAFKNAHDGALISGLGDANDAEAIRQEGERLEKELGCVFERYAVECEFSRPLTDDFMDERYTTYALVVTVPVYVTPGQAGADAEEKQREFYGDDVALDDVRSP